MLAAIGALAGSLPGFAKLLDDLSKPSPDPIGWGKVIDIAIPVGALAIVALTAILLSYSRQKDPSGDLANAIRRRTRTEVG